MSIANVSINHGVQAKNMLKTIRFLDYTFVAGSISKCVDNIAHAISETTKPRFLACLNPHSHVIAKDDPAFSEALHAADWLVPDGSGVVLASRFLDSPVYERITGSDVFYGLHDRLNHQGGGSIFFLGSTEEILAEPIRLRPPFRSNPASVK
jgi:N-acetylglucosaminyldiphosphoundecaprenol N-acetyl-beta-D-mannosaminyltransferase